MADVEGEDARQPLKPLALRRTGVRSAASTVGAAAMWSLFVGLSAAVLANVVADGSPPGAGYLLLAAAVVLTIFWLLSAYAWIVVGTTRLVAAVRRRPG